MVTPYERYLQEIDGLRAHTILLDINLQVFQPVTLELQTRFLVQGVLDDEITTIEDIYCAATYRDLALAALDGAVLPFYKDGEEDGV